MLEKQLKDLFLKSIKKCMDDEIFSIDEIPELEFETPKRAEHGDLSTNIALIIASKAKKRPNAIATAIVNCLPDQHERIIKQISVAGPGIINISIEPTLYFEQLHEIYRLGAKYGELTLGKGKKLQVEFVSANPTGPLHIGHGRGAVYGDVLGNIMKAAGYDVTKEYYVNDTGGQIRTLGQSLYLRFLEMEGENLDYPEECYQGDYIIELAKELASQSKKKILKLSQEDAINFCGEFASEKILEDIKRDLAETGVIHDTYFHENLLHTDAAVESTIGKLEKNGFVEDKDGALWFCSTRFGDDKDRVLKKSDGSYTYFAADIAYHKNKFDRGFDRVIDVWGADHGGYVARMKAGVEALGYSKDNYDAVLIQLVNLVRDGEIVSMSTRQAKYETLEDVRKEVGRDVCRYFFLMRSHNAQLDFDLELAKKDTPENPVFYLQYAHARIASVFRKAKEQNIEPEFDRVNLRELDLPEEAVISRILVNYPRIIQDCATFEEPHRLPVYLMELVGAFQAYYSKARKDPRYRIISDDRSRTNTKLYLLKNCQIVLQNAFRILGIAAPEYMAREEEGA